MWNIEYCIFYKTIFISQITHKINLNWRFISFVYNLVNSNFFVTDNV